MSCTRKFIETVSQKKHIVINLLLLILLMVSVNTVLKPSFVYLTQTFNYKPGKVYQLLKDIGANGRRTHLLVFLADITMVILYSFLLIGANYRIYQKIVKSCRWLSIIVFLPLILSTVQLGEIICLSGIITQYPKEFYSLVRTSNTFTMVKYYLTPICFILPIIGLGVTIILKSFKIKVTEHGDKR